MRRFLSPMLVVLFFAPVARGQTPAPPPAPVAEYSPASWKEFSPLQAGFSISMPGQPTAKSESVETALGPIVMHLFVLTTKLAEYGVSYADLPVRSGDPSVVRQMLDGSRDEILANGARRLIENDISLEGIVGRELFLDKEPVIGRHWIFFVEGRMYAVILATTPIVAFKNGKPSSNPSDRTELYEKICSQFFGSFRFVKNDAATLAPELSRDANDEVLAAVTAKTDLYPAGVDAKREIEEALKKGAGEKKRVMLVFGGNWCYDCHVLDQALHEGDAGKIAKLSFVIVHVDIGEGDKNLDLAKKYKIPLEKGVPAVAILDRKGDLLYSSGEGEFESARSMMKKDLVAFLTRWKEQ